MNKRARLNEIVKYCEIRFNHGDATTWKHGDFIDLNREIQRATNVNISPNTLKRIFGKIAVEEDYIPQQATLDALKAYGNFVEPEYSQPAIMPVIQPKSVVQPEAQPEPELLPIKHPQPELPPEVQADPIQRKNNFKRFRFVLIILILSAVIVGFLAWQLLMPQNITGNIKVARIEGHLPATAFFQFQTTETDDSLFVNFGDKSPLTYVKPGEKSTAHIYYIPGVFTVTVQTRQQTIATTSVYIRSNNWIALVFHNQQEIPNHFYKFSAVRSGSDSLFQVTNSHVAKMGLDTTGVILTRLCNYTPVAHNADNFIFESTFRNPLPEKSNYCRGAQFQISGSKSMIRFKLVSPGCSLRILNIVSEQTFFGATADLSQFVFDLEKWNSVKLVNHNKQVTLYVNSKQIFTGRYQRQLGDIRGVFLEFEGTGVVKKCDLKSYDGKVLYRF